MPSIPFSLRNKEAAGRVRALVLAAVAVHLTAAWFNGGYLQSDEHYQIIEFAQYKLGRQSEAGLAWEFASRMRPGLLPWLATGAIRVGHALGVVSPFLIAFSLRAVSTLLSSWVALAICVRCLRDVRSGVLAWIAVLTSSFFWLAPTLHGRFSSEAWGGALFAGGLCLMLDALEAAPEQRAKAVGLGAAAGLVWSAAFFCRFQMAASIAGAGLWFILARRGSIPLLLTMAGSFLIGCALNLVIDQWLYGTWTVTPYNYFVMNLVQGKAATFGVSPWWMLGVYLVVALIPPYSLPILALLGAGCWHARRHVLVWVSVPFVALHAAVAHKEPRFLIPLVFVVGPLFAVGVDSLPERFRNAVFAWSRTRFGRVNAAGFCIVNLVLLGIAVFMPANDSYLLDRWLWDHTRSGPITLHMVGESAIRAPGPPTDTFYADDRVALRSLETVGQLPTIKGSAPMYLFFRGLTPPPIVAVSGVCTTVLQSFPRWLARFAEFFLSIGVNPATICRVDVTS